MAARVLSSAITEAGRELAGNFTQHQEYEKAYIPWDELILKSMEQNPDLYASGELVLDDELAVE